MPSLAHSSSLALADVSKAETQTLLAGTPYEGTFDGDPKRYFESRDHASDYLERSGFVLWENEASGALEGYDRTTGKNYGGSDGAKIPP